MIFALLCYTAYIFCWSYHCCMLFPLCCLPFHVYSCLMCFYKLYLTCPQIFCFTDIVVSHRCVCIFALCLMCWCFCVLTTKSFIFFILLRLLFQYFVFFSFCCVCCFNISFFSFCCGVVSANLWTGKCLVDKYAAPVVVVVSICVFYQCCSGCILLSVRFIQVSMDVCYWYVVPIDMSRPLISIVDLRPDNNVWKLAIRVVDIWIVKEQNKQKHLDVIVRDAKVVSFSCISCIYYFVLALIITYLGDKC